MSLRLAFIGLFCTSTVFATVVPAIECRFAGLDDDGYVELDEVVTYGLDPLTEILGEFDPYRFLISAYGDSLNISVRLDKEPISEVKVPIANIAALPLGATIFGLNTVYHNKVKDFISVRYECRKLL